MLNKTSEEFADRIVEIKLIFFPIRTRNVGNHESLNLGECKLSGAHY